MIFLRINNKHLCEIFEPTLDVSSWSEEKIRAYSASKLMLPTEVTLVSETYSRDAERTADFELEHLVLVNRKAKPEFTWAYLKTEYAERLFSFLGYNYDFKDDNGTIVPRPAADIHIEYYDFVGNRTIVAYLGQTLEGTLIDYEGSQYWQNFRIAFPER